MSQRDQKQVVVRRADRPGDLGWVVMAHGEAYDQQFGWNTDFEILVAKIVADYGAQHDPAREAGWIAEVDGRRVGCVFLVAGEQPKVAKLRILLVTPEGRGFRLGTRLVGECLAFAREAGYEQVTLWTNDVLTAARKIYQSFGFTLADEERHHSFGHDLVGQNWTLDLRTDAPTRWTATAERRG
ncbi:GNAT family N-acetyltransferase [Streptomyces sp. SID8499]|uniref:GNAT family N-acetyltransferase n=1 Tax=Streptomyces sp. SID8499 TaxID=2706106 RepID=UPI0013C92FB9|nr:GNAT family N-acetyltransferase [Streptomyces sp. SID8499]NED33429.1 GNAT family N-acetyltransferase [Streptomyces sp. SID8499]